MVISSIFSQGFHPIGLRRKISLTGSATRDLNPSNESSPVSKVRLFIIELGLRKSSFILYKEVFGNVVSG
jgi:hypothetical protein